MAAAESHPKNQESFAALSPGGSSLASTPSLSLDAQSPPCHRGPIAMTR